MSALPKYCVELNSNSSAHNLCSIYGHCESGFRFGLGFESGVCVGYPPASRKVDCEVEPVLVKAVLELFQKLELHPRHYAPGTQTR